MDIFEKIQEKMDELLKTKKTKERQIPRPAGVKARKKKRKAQRLARRINRKNRK